MDFVRDTLAAGRVIRPLTVVDEFKREALQVEVDTPVPSARVVIAFDGCNLSTSNRQAELVRLRRSFQLALPRRVSESALVPLTSRCALHAGRLSAVVQHRSSSR
jgi:hypothetical protein